jgi:hypothetical protein
MNQPGQSRQPAGRVPPAGRIGTPVTMLSGTANKSGWPPRSLVDKAGAAVSR